MKDFILYLQPKGKKALFNKEIYSLEELLGTAGTPNLTELEIVKSGKLKKIDDLGDYRLLMFTCDYVARHGSSLSIVEGRDIELWQSKKGALVASFGFPRTVAKVAMKLLSLAAFGDPSFINSFVVTQTNFLDLVRQVEELEGTITRLDVRGVTWGGGQLKSLQIKGREIEKIPGFDGVLRNAKRISSMGFLLKHLDSSSRHISFRVTDYAGGQIYSPSNPLPHEIAELFSVLEQTFLGSSTLIRRA
jgi:hypothetical protein